MGEKPFNHVNKTTTINNSILNGRNQFLIQAALVLAALAAPAEQTSLRSLS